METKKHAGTIAISKSELIYEDGIWRVTQEATQKNSEDLKTWKIRTFKSEVYDKIFEVAIAKASDEFTKFLTECEFDLFAINDFKGELIEIEEGE